MAFNFSPTSYTARPLDFSPLANLPEDFWKGQAMGRQNALRTNVNDILSNGGSWEDVLKEITKADPLAGAKIASDVNYRNALLGISQQKEQRLAQAPSITPYQQHMMENADKSLALREESSKKLSQNDIGGMAMLDAGDAALNSPASEGGPSARKILSDPSKWSFSQIGQSMAPSVGAYVTKGDVVNAQAAVQTKTEAALRMMTGAAAPEAEVRRYASFFTPTWHDSANVAGAKLQRLDNFTAAVKDYATRGRNGPPPNPLNLTISAPQAAAPSGGMTGPQGAPPDRPLAPGDVVGGFRFKGGNPNDQSSWEQAQ